MRSSRLAEDVERQRAELGCFIEGSPAGSINTLVGSVKHYSSDCVYIDYRLALNFREERS